MAQPDPKMVHKVLLRAAEILEAGWCRGHFCTDGGEHLGMSKALEESHPGVDRFCIQGAMIMATKEVMGYQINRREPGQGYWRDETRVGINRIEDVLLKDQVMPLVPVVPTIGYEGPAFQPAGSAQWNDKVCQSGEEAAAICRRAADGLV